MDEEVQREAKSQPPGCREDEQGSSGECARTSMAGDGRLRVSSVFGPTKQRIARSCQISFSGLSHSPALELLRLAIDAVQRGTRVLFLKTQRQGHID